jgi:hypothetical protein
LQENPCRRCESNARAAPYESALVPNVVGGRGTCTRSRRYPAHEAGETLFLHSRSAPVGIRTRSRALRRRAAVQRRERVVAAPGGNDPPSRVS